jgi:lysophospholipase L1-like esterase
MPIRQWWRVLAIGAGVAALAASATVLVGPASAATAPPTSPADRAKCTGTAPIKCHYAVAPGNYDVTVVLGSATKAAVTTVTGEQRRTMLPTATSAAGLYKTYSFSVNVRHPEGAPSGAVGSDGLDLTFSGSAPQLSSIGVVAAAPMVMYLAGDSTVCDQLSAPYSGWGQQLPQYIKLGLSVANYGDSGESAGSFYNTASMFPAIKSRVKTNDLVLIQFGHNDKKVTKAAYQASLGAMVDGVKAKGGVPVLVTPPVRRWFTGATLNSTGMIVNELGVDLPAAMREVAGAKGVKLIDLTAKSKVLVEGLGPVNSGKIYLTKATDGVDDKTHFSAYGANELAKLVVQGMRELNLSSVSYLR